MVNCPACEQTVNEDFGMVTCPHCKAVFMIDYSGKIEYGTEEISEVDEFEDDTEEEFEEETPTEKSIVYDFPEPLDHSKSATADDNDTENEESSEESYEGGFLDDEGFEGGGVDNTDEIENNFPEENDVTYDDENDDDEGASEATGSSTFQSDLEEEEPEEIESAFEDGEEELIAETVTQLAPDNTPVDVTEFANSEESLLEGGEYRYSVTVSRIDSRDLRDDLKYVLMDEKLKLNHHEYIKNIVDGSVTIPDLHPIKAKRIVEQLQFFDLEVQWRQKRVIIEEPVEEEVYEELEDDV